MLKLFIKSTTRLLLRNSVLSSIKVIGLAIGLATFLLLGQFCVNEFQYDKQHPHHERIYRFVHRVKTPEGIQRFAFASATIGPALKEKYPEVESFHRILLSPASVRNPENEVSFNEKKFGFADQNFLKFFSFPLKDPHPTKEILKDPYSLLITPTAAAKYFGRADPIGKSLIINGQIACIVRGVFQSDFNFTHLDFDFIASFATLEAIKNDPLMAAQLPASRNLEEKGFHAFYTYLLLAQGASPAALEAKFPSFIEEFRGKGRSERLRPSLQSLDSIHLNSSLLYEITPNGSAQTAYIFLAIGILILLIACINYVNTTTAEFVNRMRGTALKKILGITKGSLLGNQLIETALLTLVALALAVLLGYLLSPEFNTLLNRKSEFFTPSFFAILVSVFVFTTLVSWSYPAWVITQTTALDAFKGNLTTRQSLFSLRNILVFVQLFISFSLVSVAILIYTQIDFLLSQKLGFESEQVLVVNGTSASPLQRRTLKVSFLQHKEIIGVAACSTPPGGNLMSYGISLPENSSEEDRRVGVYQSFVDADYLNTLGIELENGRFFNSYNPTDSDSYLVVNRAAADVIGDSIMNRKVSVPTIFGSEKNLKSVIGIVGNFHFASLHRQIEPLILEYNPDQSSFFLIRVGPGAASGAVRALEKEWRATASLLPLEYYFLDDGFAKLYNTEQKQKKLVALFALLAVGLAALGIFGTMLFWVQQKTREISIRKVLGSEGTDLFLMLARPVIGLIIASCLTGLPAARFAGVQWLEQYPYRIEFSPFLFVFAFLFIFVVVLSTLMYHFLKVIRLNPVKVLKDN